MSDAIKPLNLPPTYDSLTQAAITGLAHTVNHYVVARGLKAEECQVDVYVGLGDTMTTYECRLTIVGEPPVMFTMVFPKFSK